MYPRSISLKSQPEMKMAAPPLHKLLFPGSLKVRHHLSCIYSVTSCYEYLLSQFLCLFVVCCFQKDPKLKFLRLMVLEVASICLGLPVRLQPVATLWTGAPLQENAVWIGSEYLPVTLVQAYTQVLYVFYCGL